MKFYDPNYYDESTKTYFLESMLHLSIVYILLIGNGYKLNSIYSNCGFSGEGFILLALTKKEEGKLMEYLINNARLDKMKEYKPTFGEYKDFDEASEEYIFDRLEEWAKSVIYMHHRKSEYLYVNSFCWIDSNDTHYLTAFFRSNDILEKLDEIEEVKLSYILPNRSNRP